MHVRLKYYVSALMILLFYAPHLLASTVDRGGVFMGSRVHQISPPPTPTSQPLGHVQLQRVRLQRMQPQVIQHQVIIQHSMPRTFVIEKGQTLLENINKLSNIYGWSIRTTSKEDLKILFTRTIVFNNYQNGLEQLINGYPVRAELYTDNKVAKIVFL